MDILTTFPDTSILQLAATIALEFCMNQILSEKFLPNITFKKEASSNITLSCLFMCTRKHFYESI